MFKLHNSSDFIEFYFDPEQSTLTNLTMLIKVKANGFAGVHVLNVSKDRLAAFYAAVLNLEKTKVGEAKLLSENPGELEISLRPTGLLETLMLASGTLTNITHLEHGPVLHSVTFGFEFPARLLSEMIQFPWMQQFTS